MRDEKNFKRSIEYTSLYESLLSELILCTLYEQEEKACKNPRKECKNCSVYHGFKSSENLYKKNKLKNEIHSE